MVSVSPLSSRCGGPSPGGHRSPPANVTPSYSRRRGREAATEARFEGHCPIRFARPRKTLEAEKSRWLGGHPCFRPRLPRGRIARTCCVRRPFLTSTPTARFTAHPRPDCFATGPPGQAQTEPHGGPIAAWGWRDNRPAFEERWGGQATGLVGKAGWSATLFRATASIRGPGWPGPWLDWDPKIFNPQGAGRL